MTKLSVIDTGFLLAESHNSPKHVACLQIFRLPKGKGGSWLRRLLEELKQVEPAFPFNQKLVTSHSLQPGLTIDENLEMDYHVRHTVLPRPGTDDQLWGLIARLHANLLDRERPLWEFYLVEGLSERRFAFYTKMHHALADGVSMNRWFVEAGSVNSKDLKTPPIWQRDRTPGKQDVADPAYGQLMVEGIKTLGDGVKTAYDLTKLSLRLLLRRFIEGNRDVTLPLAAPRTAFNVATGAARNLAARSYSLDLIKAIGRSHRASVNDVLLTVCDIAVNRYFQQKGNFPKEPLVAYMPVNLRTDGSEEDGNLVSLLQVRLSSNHGDPLEALQQIKSSSKTARDVFSGFGKPAIQIYTLVVAFLAQLEESLKLGGFMLPANNLVISNVPGPKETLYFRGAETISAYPISTLAPLTALNVTANSYAGRIHVGLVSGRTAIPDLGVLVRHMDEAVSELAEASDVEVKY